MKTEDLYSSAHLMVAAIRVRAHCGSTQPTVDEVCALVSLSLEQGHYLCKRLEDLGIIEAVEGAFGVRLFIKDHLKIEDIPKNVKISTLAEDLKKFQDSKKGFSQKIESIKAAQEEKKKSLFAEMEKKLKEEINKKKSRD